MRFSVFTASTPDRTPAHVPRHLADAGADGVEWRVTDQSDDGMIRERLGRSHARNAP